MKGRTAVKRSFKVATAFTGAAACAFGLTPTATAVPVAPTSTKIPAFLGAHNCTGQSPEAIHLYYPASRHHPTPACVSRFSGSPQPLNPPIRFQSYCGGAFSGLFAINGSRTGHFTRGNAKHNLFNVVISSVFVSRINTAGAVNCPAR
jgi:hypothetical protein